MGRMYIAIQKLIDRQYKVPHPLVDGLVFVSFGAVSGTAALEAMHALINKIEENELVKIIESN
jgi:hypothetical protein